MECIKGDKCWALVLGASSGFGAACAIKLAEMGLNVIGVHLDRRATLPKVEEIKDKIKSHGSDALFFNHNAADETKRKEILDNLESMKEGKPKIKVLLHSLAFGSLKNFIGTDNEKPITQAQMEMTLDVMAHSLVYWTQDLVARNLLVNGSNVFAMTSSGSNTVMPYYGAVSAAKAALEAHVRQLSYELGERGIAVNAVLAGVTDTPALRKIPGSDKMIEIAKRKNPRGRLTTPEEVARVVSAIVKSEINWLNGSIIHADGGEDAVNYVGQNEDRV